MSHENEHKKVEQTEKKAWAEPQVEVVMPISRTASGPNKPRMNENFSYALS